MVKKPKDQKRNGKKTPKIKGEMERKGEKERKEEREQKGETERKEK